MSSKKLCRRLFGNGDLPHTQEKQHSFRYKRGRGVFFRTAKREATSLLQAAGGRNVALGSEKVQTTLLNDFSLIS